MKPRETARLGQQILRNKRSNLPINSTKFFILVVPTIGAVTPSFERDHIIATWAIDKPFLIARSSTLSKYVRNIESLNVRWGESKRRTV